MDFHKFSVFIKSAHQNRSCPPYHFFFHQKKVRFPTLILFLHFPIFFISNDTNLSQLLPKKQTTSHFYMTYPTSTRNCYFYCLLNPIHFFFSQKNKPLCPIIAITKCNEMTRQIQKETKFRFITKHITPFPQKKRPKKQKIEQKNVKKRMAKCKTKTFSTTIGYDYFHQCTYPF